MGARAIAGYDAPMNASDLSAMRPEDLVACPGCDLLHRRRALRPGEVARCARCGAVLETRKPGTVDRVIAASLAMVALVALAVTGPFLTLRELGLERTVSLLDASAALGAGGSPLGVLLLLVIAGLPTARALAHLYVLAPWRLGWGMARGAAAVFRWSSSMRPWAMAEIFMIGVAVSMVKIAGIAAITPGPAFWALGGAVAVLAFENAALCRETVWRLIGESRDGR